MKNLNKAKYFIFVALIFPNLTFAFDLFASDFKGVVFEILGLINILTPILAGLALLFFFWGLSKFILNANKPEEIKNGRNYMLWGILALFILLTFRTLIGAVSNELEIGGEVPVIPELKTTRS